MTRHAVAAVVLPSIRNDQTMSPPADNLTVDRRHQISDDDLGRVRWFGWTVAGVLLLGWSGWISLLAINNSVAVHRNTARYDLHYVQLREDIAELKAMVKALLKVTVDEPIDEVTR